METKPQRVVVKGWYCKVSPVRALELFAAISKVSRGSLQNRRSNGLQRTLVVCFQREVDALAARGWYNTVGGVVCAVGAYNMRMSYEHAEGTGCEAMVEGGSPHTGVRR